MGTARGYIYMSIYTIGETAFNTETQNLKPWKKTIGENCGDDPAEPMPSVGYFTKMDGDKEEKGFHKSISTDFAKLRGREHAKQASKG